MRILITTIVDPVNSAHSRLHEFARHLSESHDVTILSIEDHWKKAQPAAQVYRGDFDKNLSKVKVIYLTDKRRSIITQELLSAYYIKRLKEASRLRDYDLIIDYNSIMIGRRASELLGDIPRIYDIADDIVDMIRISTQLPIPLNLIASFIANSMITRNIAEADLISATCNQLLDRYCVPNDRRRLVPNGVPKDFLAPIPDDEIIDSRENPNEFLIGYVGVLREWLDLETVLRAMAELKERFPIRLMIIGEEGRKEELLDKARKIGLEEAISMIGTIPHERIRQYLAACDCGIIPFKSIKTTELAMPLKLFEYFSAGNPVISTPMRSIGTDFENEVFFYSGEKELVEIIDRIRRNPDEGCEKASIAREKVLRKYTWERIGEEYGAIIESMAVTER